ncbi:MAG: VanW family protein [Bacillota bacterium]|nr:VanW family protein [Bacillota bacterium]
MAAYRAALPDPILNEAYNIALAADTLAGTVVQPGEVFSQNRRLGPYTADRGYREGPTYAGTRIIATCGGGVCKIASLLYNVAVLSNLEVVERSPHSMTVPYVPPGQDATVYYGQYDFRFRNNTGGPIVLWADTKDNALYMAAYGRSTPPRVIWHHQTLKRIPAPVEYRFNPGLAPGTEKVVMPGQEGVVVRTWITIQGPGGRTVVKQMGVDSYDPNPRVIERGPAGIRNT